MCVCESMVRYILAEQSYGCCLGVTNHDIAGVTI